MKPRYKLLKDLPGLAKGAIFKWDGEDYTCKVDRNSFGGICDSNEYYCSEVQIESYIEWFEKID